MKRSARGSTELKIRPQPLKPLHVLSNLGVAGGAPCVVYVVTTALDFCWFLCQCDVYPVAAALDGVAPGYNFTFLAIMVM